MNILRRESEKIVVEFHTKGTLKERKTIKYFLNIKNIIT